MQVREQLGAVFVMLMAVACGGTSASSSEGQAALAAPPTIAINGREYLRRDLWSDADLATILYEGRADQANDSPEVLAAQLRGQTMNHGVYYIEAEPNLALAQKILAGDFPQGSPGQEPREGRGVFGTDNRTRVTSGFPFTTMAFNESRGSGNRIGRSTIYTAAHVVYNRTDPSVANGWYCFDGSTNVTGNCALPRWRFGVNDTNGATPWTAYACYSESVPTAWLSVTSTTNSYDSTRWDYAAVDISSCNIVNSGWIGTWILNDQTIATTTVQNFGYAERVPCPSGSSGSAADCPNGVFQLTGNHEPYTGARLWTFANGTVTAGVRDTANTIQSTNIDATHGDSGSAIIFGLNSATDYRAIGVTCVATSSVNIYSRFTGETYNFLTSVSHFPADTM
jgi:V8-like Glu-specific endopeptidase